MSGCIKVMVPKKIFTWFIPKCPPYFHPNVIALSERPDLFSLFSNIAPNNALIKRQKKLREGCWRMAEIGGSQYLVSVESIKNTALNVKVMDPRTAVANWERVDVTRKQLSPTFILTSETLEELIVNLKRTGILHSPSVELALIFLDRQYFCPKNPYHDCAIDIGDKQYGACISSPHMHVWAAELLKNHLSKSKACLDVGSGSGYFTALMKVLAPQARVYGIEYYSNLIEDSKGILKEHYPELSKQITFVERDGEKGFVEGAPFHAIHVGFMCRTIPTALMDQLALGGRMLVPVSNGKSSTFDNRCIAGVYTCVDRRTDRTFEITKLFSCSFVPSMSQPPGDGSSLPPFPSSSPS